MFDLEKHCRRCLSEIEIEWPLDNHRTMTALEVCGFQFKLQEFATILKSVQPDTEPSEATWSAREILKAAQTLHELRRWNPARCDFDELLNDAEKDRAEEYRGLADDITLMMDRMDVPEMLRQIENQDDWVIRSFYRWMILNTLELQNNELLSNAAETHEEYRKLYSKFVELDRKYKDLIE